MYKGPGNNYDIILYLQKGETVLVLGANNKWAYIKWSVGAGQQTIDYYGYVNRALLSINIDIGGLG